MATLNTFVWTGIDKSGRKNRGEVLAASQALAKAQLRMQGISAKTVRRKVRPLVSFGSRKIKSSDIALFTRQMATMMKAGVPLIQSFDIVADGVENQLMRNLVTDIKTDVAAGGGLAASLARHPKYFDELFCNLVESGEQSGALETMLHRIAIYKEKTEQLIAQWISRRTDPLKTRTAIGQLGQMKLSDAIAFRIEDLACLLTFLMLCAHNIRKVVHIATRFLSTNARFLPQMQTRQL